MYKVGIAGVSRGKRFVSSSEAHPEMKVTAICHVDSEYFMIRDFLKAVATNSRPPIDVVKSIEMTVPGIVAHESARKGGVWLDVPQYEW